MELNYTLLAFALGLVGMLMTVMRTMSKNQRALDAKLDGNGALIRGNATKIAEANTKIEVNTVKIDALAVAVAGNKNQIEASRIVFRDQLESHRAENREDFRELNRKVEKLDDKVDANAVRHEKSIRKVG